MNLFNVVSVQTSLAPYFVFQITKSNLELQKIERDLRDELTSKWNFISYEAPVLQWITSCNKKCYDHTCIT